MAGTKDIKDFTKYPSLSDNDYLLGTKTDLGGTDAGITVADFKKLVAQDVKPTIKNGYWWVNGVNTGELATGRTPNFRYTANGLEMKYDNEDDTAYQVIIPIEDLLFTFDDLTPEQVELLKLKFSDLTETEKDELRGKAFTYDDFTSEQLADLRMTWDKLTPAQKKELQGERGYSAFEVWEQQEDNSGKTVDDYLAWLRQPATDAATAVGEIIKDANAVIEDAGKATDRANRAAEAAEGVIAGVVPTKLSELDNDTGFVTNTVANLTNYYLKSETYSRDEVLSLISQIKSVSFLPVESLPTTGETNIIYLRPKEGTADDVYNEYIWIESTGKYELIGSTSVDLSDYYTKEEALQNFATKEELDNLRVKYLDLTPLFNLNEGDYFDDGYFEGVLSQEYVNTISKAYEDKVYLGKIYQTIEGIMFDFIVPITISQYTIEGSIYYSILHERSLSDVFGYMSFGSMSEIEVSTGRYYTFITIPEKKSLILGDISQMKGLTNYSGDLTKFLNNNTYDNILDALNNGTPIFFDRSDASTLPGVYGCSPAKSISFRYSGNEAQMYFEVEYYSLAPEKCILKAGYATFNSDTGVLRNLFIKGKLLIGYDTVTATELPFNGGSCYGELQISNGSWSPTLTFPYGTCNDGDETHYIIKNTLSGSTITLNRIYDGDNIPVSSTKIIIGSFPSLGYNQSLEMNIKYVNDVFYFRFSEPF